MKKALMLLVFSTIVLSAPHLQAEDTETLLGKASAAYNAGDFDKCADYYGQATALGLSDPNIYYNAACCYSLAGRVDSAFTCLYLAIQDGYRNVDHLKVDPDLEPLHSHRNWPAAVRSCQMQLDAFIDRNNRELYELYRKDEAEFSEAERWGDNPKFNPDRVERVRQMLRDTLLSTGDDFYHAASIFYNGKDSTDYQAAYNMTMEAAKRGCTYSRLHWLSAASIDRYLWSKGLSQRYGTQMKKVNGLWTIEPIDKRKIKDEDRRKVNVASLAEIQRRLDDLNKAAEKKGKQ